MNRRAVTVRDLCEQRGHTYDTLPLNCVFCRQPLCPFDKVLFDLKHLILLLKEDGYLGCCTNCLFISADLEFRFHYQCSAFGFALEALTEKSLQDLLVRCQYCLTKLSNLEKENYRDTGEPFHLVKGGWRGRCSIC
ncbi:E6 protein [Vulpes vulpes papillomavirus 1]|uniref:Protein E6 n=1 Tax=Vulpes vulpes papillomavirus 1 TaxID=1163709 RepID=A0A0A7BVM4_9PAPI|nr:E6 protein [Vulpes vulpes papillomavirus 1]AHM27266.1 E6 protein [Vulpes vulpes papillomavirus 1]